MAHRTAGDRADKLRALARELHPDAHPDATAEEKQGLGQQFAEELAKLGELDTEGDTPVIRAERQWRENEQRLAALAKEWEEQRRARRRARRRVVP